MNGIVAIASVLLAVSSALAMAGQADIYDWSRDALHFYWDTATQRVAWWRA